MQLLVEEASWAWDGMHPSAYIERIEQLLDRLDVAREREEPYAASRELWAQQIDGQHTLADLFWGFSGPLHLPHEVDERITALFNTMIYWDDDAAWAGFEATIGGRDVISPSAVFAHAHSADGDAVACVPLPGTWRGPVDVVADGHRQVIHFVSDESSHRAFFRGLCADEARLKRYASHAFPELLFLEGTWRGLRDLEGGYLRVRQPLHQVLALLDDHGSWVFGDESGRLSQDEPLPPAHARTPATNQLIERRFKRWGIEIAPEHVDVRNHGKCRRARERVLNGRTLYCEWHYKFERHINRMHIHPPVPESGGRLIVAILCDHLPLPKE